MLPARAHDIRHNGLESDTMNRKNLLTILWPAFLMAGVLEMMVFAVVDPAELHGSGGELLGWSSQAVYTLSFVSFWGVISAAGVLTWFLNQTREAINTRTFR